MSRRSIFTSRNTRPSIVVFREQRHFCGAAPNPGKGGFQGGFREFSSVPARVATAAAFASAPGVLFCPVPTTAQRHSKGSADLRQPHIRHTVLFSNIPCRFNSMLPGSPASRPSDWHLPFAEQSIRLALPPSSDDGLGKQFAETCRLL